MTSISPQSAQLSTNQTGTSNPDPNLVAIVQSMPAEQQAQAMAELQQMTPEQQQALLQQLAAQAQSQGARGATGQAAGTTGAQSATLGAEQLQPPSKLKTILKNVAIFGAAGAALGFGASFLTLPVVGQVAAPIAAAIGGAVGIIAGIVTGLTKHKKEQATYDAAVQTPPSAPVPMTEAATTGLEESEDAGAEEPDASDPVDAPAPTNALRTYTVKAGDCLWTIARRYGTAWQEIYRHNRKAVGSNPDLIHPGLKLEIPE